MTPVDNPLVANVAGIATTAAASAVTSPLATQYLGAPIACFGYAAIGSVLSYAWGDPEERRLMLLFKVTSTTFFSVAAAVILPDLVDWEIRESSLPALSLMIAMFARWLIPAFRKGIPALVKAAMETLGSAIGARRRSDDSWREMPPRDMRGPGDYERHTPPSRGNDDVDQGY